MADVFRMATSRIITVFTDGSSLGNPGPGGWAWWRHDGCWTAGALPHTTNQQAELIAILMALKQVPKSMPLRIASDSQYGVNLASKWLVAWKKAGWRTAAGQQVANLSIVKHLDAAIMARVSPTEFVWVRGHSGVKGNEEADSAATAAAHAERYGRNIPTGPGWRDVAAPKSSASKRAGLSAGARRTSVPAPHNKNTAQRDKGRSPGTVRSDGALMGGRPEEGLAVMKCSACGATLHPLSLECRCTR